MLVEMSFQLETIKHPVAKMCNKMHKSNQQWTLGPLQGNSKTHLEKQEIAFCSLYNSAMASYALLSVYQSIIWCSQICYAKVFSKSQHCTCKNVWAMLMNILNWKLGKHCLVLMQL